MLRSSRKNLRKCTLPSWLIFFRIWLNDIDRETSRFDCVYNFLSLFRMTWLLQNAINLIIQFIQMIIEIFKKHIVASRYWFFIDDINIKDSRSNYNEKEFLSEIWLFIMKHFQWLNAVLVNLGKTDCIISNKRSRFCLFELKIVDFICDSNDKFSKITKITKIFEWYSYCNVSKVRAVINVCVYYRR